jgi:hypothetical protein
MRAEGPGGIIGDGVGEIGPEHPTFAAWNAYLTHVEERSSSPRPDPRREFRDPPVVVVPPCSCSSGVSRRTYCDDAPD